MPRCGTGPVGLDGRRVEHLDTALVVTVEGRGIVVKQCPANRHRLVLAEQSVSHHARKGLRDVLPYYLLLLATVIGL